MKMSDSCVGCLLGKNLKKYPASATQEQIAAYQKEICAALEARMDLSAPEMVERLEQIRFAHFGADRNFSEIKRHFNRLMSELEPHLRETVAQAEDPLQLAVRYAMAGNFIDFGALDCVDEDKLRMFLESADRTELDRDVLDTFKRELSVARKLVYLTDNCGEIVADKVLIEAIKQRYPKLHVTVVLRGSDVLNDATEEDAEQVGLSAVADAIMGNGTGIAGTVLTRIGEQAKQAILEADLLISKGQGNYESLCGCGLNVFYLFLCKCELFVNRFGVPQYSGILTWERK